MSPWWPRSGTMKGRLLATAALSTLLAGCSLLHPSPWHSRYERDHPLVGRFWSTAEQRFVDFSRVVAGARRSTYVLVGEAHENRDHHDLQARVFAAVVESGRRPALLMEMLDTRQSDGIEQCLGSGHCDGQTFRRAVAWDRSGWPRWSWYAPIVEVALANHLTIAAANLPRDRLRAIAHDGTVPADLAQRLQTIDVLDERLERQLEEDIQASHCNHAPAKMVATMALAQKVRDAYMADVLSQYSEEGAVFIAGNGHVRTDRGVPLHLAARQPSASIVAIGALEVRKELVAPRQYAELLHGDRLPFDYVWFSPRAGNKDPCEEFRKQLEKMESQWQDTTDCVPGEDRERLARPRCSSGPAQPHLG